MATSDDSEELAELPQRNPAWRTETVLAIARGILMEDAMDRYPILADALEEAGCDDYDLLAMLRADVEERQGELLDWVLQDDPEIDALLMERHEQFQRKRQQQAQAILEDESKRKLNRFNPTLGFVAVVSIFCLCQINNQPKQPKFDTHLDFKPLSIPATIPSTVLGRKLVGRVDGRTLNSIRDKSGNQVSPATNPSIGK